MFHASPASLLFIIEESICFIFLNVFQTIQCYCNKDDNTREYELEVGINTQDCEGVC